jgi:hypothetical protein
MLTGALLRRLLIVLPKLQFAIDPFALQLFLQDAKCLIRVVVTYDDKRSITIEDWKLLSKAGDSTRAIYIHRWPTVCLCEELRLLYLDVQWLSFSVLRGSHSPSAPVKNRDGGYRRRNGLTSKG